LAPVGYSRLMHPGGEVAAARGGGEAGTVYTRSTIAGHRLEDVKAASAGPVWYQLYLVGGREAAEAAIARARAAGFSALVVTVDTPVAGMRERDLRNGTNALLGGSLMAKIPFLPQLLAHPAWLTKFLLDGGVPRLPNVVIPGRGPMPLTDARSALARAALTWDDLRWIRGIWPGATIIKGVLTGDDARRAIDAGGAAGVAGVGRPLAIWRVVLERTLRRLGCASISALDRSYVDSSRLTSSSTAFTRDDLGH